MLLLTYHLLSLDALQKVGHGNKGGRYREMMWRANFTYQPEYFIYSHLIGPTPEEFVARVILLPHQVEGETCNTPGVS
jgi:hypothetical protein